MERSGEVKLSCSHVSKAFDTPNGPFKVLEDLSFDVRENEFLVIFGPGQCGKTTLLNIMSGLDSPTSGEVTHNGAAVTAPDPSRAVVYQTMALFPWMTVQGNVSYSLRVKGMPKAQRNAEAQKYIDLVGLTGFEKSFPVQLSGGMKQRVGIARAYCCNPDVLLMDEPFGHLDAQTRYMMQESLADIWQKEKRTVAFVTNNIEEALYLADRILLLTDCPSHVCEEYVIDLPRPRNLMDAEFLRMRKEITARMGRTEE